MPASMMLSDGATSSCTSISCAGIIPGGAGGIAGGNGDDGGDGSAGGGGGELGGGVEGGALGS